MPKQIQITAYPYEELSETAQARARDWLRGTDYPHDFWDDAVLEDFQEICRIIGIELDVAPRDHASRFKIWYTLAYCQGDGASFEGTYSHARGASRRIREHAPEDTSLHSIVDGLIAAQRENFYQLTASITQSGRYTHEYTMRFDIERWSSTGQTPTDSSEDQIIQNMRALARWLYRQLDEENTAYRSDETVAECLIDGQQLFTEDGTWSNVLNRYAYDEIPVAT